MNKPNLTWPEIRARAAAFAKSWAGVVSERAEAQTFWNEFFEIFGVRRRRVAVYEQSAERFGKKHKGRIDVFWPGTLLAEHKSAGEDLDAAFAQATDYFAGLREEDLPKFVVVSDFRRIRLYDLDEKTHADFALTELPAQIQRFGFIAGFGKVRLRDEPEANIKAVQRLGDLHDALKRNRYGLDPAGRAGHPLQVFLVRLLFCLFADDTGLFSPKDSFLDLIETAKDDGSDTGAELAKLFEVLNTPPEQRQASQVEKYAPFPFVNGRLFEERLPIPEFDAEMRRLLLDCCALQWANISPAIFGAMFQKVIELDASDRRRQLGAHYTSEANILKLIGPLFLDGLRAEFARVRDHEERLSAFHRKLPTLHFLDPACGCGNFLVITYRELRRLELDVLQAAHRFGEPDPDAMPALFKVSLSQFHGIEIEEFPAQVAQVAMWLTQHQMDLRAGLALGGFFRHLPLETSANIRQGDALRLDWDDFVPPGKLSFILGNPPFVGKQYQTPAQKESLDAVAGKVKGAGVLDFVAGWYLKAAQYLSGSKEGFASRDKGEFADVEFKGKRAPARTRREDAGIEDIFVAHGREDRAARERVRCAFVSTSSIVQGEQVGVLWSEMFRRGIKIHFAHRTFKWTNEAPGKAAVHCVIVGFGLTGGLPRRLYDYAEVDGKPHLWVVENINPYLANAPDVLLSNRREPLCAVPPMQFGSMPNDGGHLLLSDEEKHALLDEEPAAGQWVLPFLGADEFINGQSRWCLWLADIPPHMLKTLPAVLRRVEAVREHRERSSREATRKLAATPTLFGEIRQPQGDYLLVPGVSSEKRRYIPMGFLPPQVIASNAALVVPNAGLYHFGVMSSAMHMAWVRYVCGRLESRYRYSAQIVYNNFPWPRNPGDDRRIAIETAAQAVLDARAAHVGSTLADLYDPGRTPPDLVKAHRTLDKAVDAAYGQPHHELDAPRVSVLFERYIEMTRLV